MSDLSIEYSLNTPNFLTNNILEQKIFDLARNNIMNGGGLDMTNCISLLIGVIIIIIGFVLLWVKNDLIESEAIIKTKSCDESSGCKINIIYTVDSTQYSKIITMNNIPNTNTIKIFYQSSNPNSIQLFNPNYLMISIGLIMIGIGLVVMRIGLVIHSNQ